MKKFLKGFGIFFFSSGIVVYTIGMFEEPDIFPIFLIMDLLFAFFIYLILHNRKPKSQVETASMYEVSSAPEVKKKPIKHETGSDDQFFFDNLEYIQKMNHQIVAPRMKDYGDIDSYRLAYEVCLSALHTLKDFCYATPAGKKWFEDYYCHCFNSKCDDFSLEAKIEAGYQDLIENWNVYEQKFKTKQEETDFLIENGPYIRRTLHEIISSEPGILQKDIYSRFNPSYRNAIISILGAMNREKVIFREPYKNTFKLYVSPPVLRNQSVPPISIFDD